MTEPLTFDIYLALQQTDLLSVRIFADYGLGIDLQPTEQILMQIKDLIQTTVGSIINRRIKRAHFNFINNSYQLDSLTLDCINKELVPKSKILPCLSHIKIARVTMPYQSSMINFSAESLDRIKYTASALICYQSWNLDQSLFDSYLEQARDHFIDSWSKNTLGDIIETYDKRSDSDKSVFIATPETIWLDINASTNFLHGYIRNHRYLGLVIIVCKCMIHPQVEASIVRKYVPYLKAYDNRMVRLFSSMSGCIGYIAYRYGPNRYRHPSHLKLIRDCYLFKNISYPIRSTIIGQLLAYFLIPRIAAYMSFRWLRKLVTVLITGPPGFFY